MYRTSSASPMLRLDDPWFWGVDRVVATLCNPNGRFLTRFLRDIDPITIPDLNQLERELIKHKISGLVMLTELTQPVLRDEFGIAAMGQRTVIIHMIMDLRRQSDKYVEHLKENKIMYGIGRRSESMSSPIASPSRTLFDSFTFTENLPASLVSLGRAPPPASGLSNQNLPISPARSARSAQEFNKSPKRLKGENESLSQLQEEAIPTTEHEIQLADARIDAIVYESAAMQGKRDYRSNATTDFTHYNATVDDTRTDTREDMILPRDSDRKNETYIVDENGKKRRRLVLIPVVAAGAASVTSNDSPTLQCSAEQPSPQLVKMANQLRDPTPSDVASSITLKDVPDHLLRSIKRNRNSRQMYLGIESLPVDELFYGTTEIGEEVSHDVDYGEIWQSGSRESSENFSFFGNHFGAGQRCYVYGRLKHYLYYRNSRTVKRQGQRVIVVIPYPDYFRKKHHQRSVTVYTKSSGKVIASRMDRSQWTGNEGISSENHVFRQMAPNLLNVPCPEEIDPTNWDYLKKWDFQVGEDRVLPVFGESSSENEDDLETWRKIEKEERSLRRRGLDHLKSKKRKLTTESVEQAINDATEQILTHWTIVEKPKLFSKAWKLWSDARRENMVPEQIYLWSNKIRDLEIRLSKLRKEIMKEEWTSAQEVIKQCKSMEQSIYDQEGFKWRISTVKLKTAPEKPPPRQKTGRRAKSDSNQPQQESGETSDSGDLSDFESSDDDIADFIDDEHIHDEIIDPVDVDDDSVLEDSKAGESIHGYVSDSYDEGSEKFEDTSDEDVRPNPPTRRQSIIEVKETTASPAKVQPSKSPGIIDLTIESEPSEGEAASRNYLDMSSPLAPSPRRSGLGNGREDTYNHSRTRKPLFRVPPGSSAIICLDSDLSDDTETDEDPADSTNIFLPGPPREKKPKRRELPENSGDTPRKKRKFAVPESQQAIALRLEAQERFQRILKRRFREMDVNHDGSSKVAINTGKLDDQEFIYINPKIARRMQPHQKDGVQFMWREVIAERQGCLVAQTMGLGKTMQVVTLLVTVAEAVRSTSENIRNQVPQDFHESRTLIICPPALIENWWEEFLMWTPGKLENGEFKENIGSLRKVNSTMSIEGRLSEIEGWMDRGGVLLIGFHTFRDLITNKPNARHGNCALDVEQHQMVQDALLERPNIIVADEAHHFKSTTAEINQIINRLKSKSRIALTGSPLSNNLMEYHSLVDWVAPNFMGTRVEFQANYVERIQDGLYQDSTIAEYRASLKWLEVLKNELRPKVHRADITALRERLKGKQEFVIKVNLTPLQEKVYSVFVEARLATAASDEVNNSRIWAWLYSLGLICSHPVCFKHKLLEEQKEQEAERKGKSSKEKKHKKKKHADGEIEEMDASVSEIETSPGVVQRQLALFENLTEPPDSISYSNKMLILMDIVKISVEAGDKVLIFSHHLDTLDYAGKQMREAGVSYSRIDGKVLPTDRQKVTKDFNAGNIQVCLISTRAGGQGLNLHSANRVVILDEHFNPMYEEQAVGRAYRIGQKKSVFVYYLIAAGTFEELVQNQSVFKQQLARRVVDNRNPARRAIKKMGDYLFYPKLAEQKDLQAFSRKDPEVLDRILEKYSEYVLPVLRVYQNLTWLDTPSSDR